MTLTSEDSDVIFYLLKGGGMKEIPAFFSIIISAEREMTNVIELEHALYAAVKNPRESRARIEREAEAGSTLSLPYGRCPIRLNGDEFEALLLWNKSPKNLQFQFIDGIEPPVKGVIIYDDKGVEKYAKLEITYNEGKIFCLEVNLYLDWKPSEPEWSRLLDSTKKIFAESQRKKPPYSSYPHLKLIR